MTIANIKEILLHEVNILPPDYCPEVLHFIETLKTNRQSALPDTTFSDTMLLSESALAKDWDTTEEDTAWASL